MSPEQRLNQIRQRIDELDEQIQSLISERARLAQDVARVKQGDGEGAVFYRPEREAEILRRVMERNQGPLDNEAVARLFREIMSACLSLEQALRIAFLGPEGTFTQAAVFKHFGHAVTTVPLGAIDEIFREVESGGADFGVVPVENSSEGVINHTLDMFVTSPLKICGEVELRVHHCLMGRDGDSAGIKRLYSHQQSLAQCREWLDANLAEVERVEVSSNAEAARRAAQEPGTAAIAGAIAAEIYGLTVLKANIEDRPDNTTRFLVVGREYPEPSGDDKTSLLVTAKNKPGALHILLQPLAANHVSMTRIESRPTRVAMWEYFFFIDIEGHARDPNVATALEALAEEAAVLKILGAYPRAVMRG